MNTSLIPKDFALTRADAEDLQRRLSTLPQAEGLVTEHISNGGIYCRKLFSQAGTAIVGKVHKSEHLFLCALGSIIVWNEEGKHILHAGDVLKGHIGTKRIIYALTDAIVMAIHKTDLTDPEEIERELIEEDPSAMFDALNNPKLPALEA